MIFDLLKICINPEWNAWVQSSRYEFMKKKCNMCVLFRFCSMLNIARPPNILPAGPAALSPSHSLTLIYSISPSRSEVNLIALPPPPREEPSIIP